MRTTQEIMEGISIYYFKQEEGYNMYFVQDNYSHSLRLVLDTLKYAKQIGCTVPKFNNVKVEVLKGEKYNRIMSIEFSSTTLPKNRKMWELTQDSGLWRWLVYQDKQCFLKHTVILEDFM